MSDEQKPDDGGIPVPDAWRHIIRRGIETGEPFDLWSRKFWSDLQHGETLQRGDDTLTWDATINRWRCH